jgi:DNA-binding transcriptional LysR family regulator
MIDVEGLRLVALLATTRSVTRTAQVLRVHVATVYRRLAELERQLGQLLFSRAERFAVTPVGEEIVAAWERIAAGLGELERRLADHDGRLAGEVTLTTPDTLAPLVLRCLPAILDEHPSLRVKLRVSNEFSDLARREADIAIRPTAYPPETLVGRRLADVEYALYGPDGARAIVPGDALSSIPAAQWWQDRLDATGPALTVDSIWAAGQACAAGLGRAVLPTYLETLMPLPLRSATLNALRSAVWLLYHPESRRSPRIRLVSRTLGSALVTLLRTPHRN